MGIDRMQKALGTSRRWLITLTLSIFVIIYLAWTQVPEMLSTKMSYKLDTFVQIGDISYSPWKLTITKLHIGNPNGYSLPEALSCQSISIQAFTTEYLKNEIVIDSIVMDGVYLGLEFDKATSAMGNWTTLMSSLNQDEGSSNKANPTARKTVLIKKLLIRKINTDILYRDSKGKVIHLPEIEELEFDNISSEGGFPINQLMNSVLGKMLKAVFEKENLKNMLQDLINQPHKRFNQMINPFKSFRNANPEEKKEILPS